MNDRSTGNVGAWMVGTTLVSLALVSGLVIWQPKPSVILPSLVIIGCASAVILWQRIAHVLFSLARMKQDRDGQIEANGDPARPPHATDTAPGQLSRASTEIGRATETVAADAARQATAVAEVTRRLQALSARCEETAQVVEVLDDLARQTNVLALNAALEASRAGPQGRGIATIADEVRKLAERSATATRDIGAFIQSIEASANEATRVIENIGALAHKMVTAADETRHTAKTLNDSLDDATISRP